jgi:hypothetical protein
MTSGTVLGDGGDALLGCHGGADLRHDDDVEVGAQRAGDRGGTGTPPATSRAPVAAR